MSDKHFVYSFYLLQQIVIIYENTLLSLTVGFLCQYGLSKLSKYVDINKNTLCQLSQCLNDMLE